MHAMGLTRVGKQAFARQQLAEIEGEGVAVHSYHGRPDSARTDTETHTHVRTWGARGLMNGAGNVRPLSRESVFGLRR